jgi:hypothetical protein
MRDTLWWKSVIQVGMQSTQTVLPGIVFPADMMSLVHMGAGAPAFTLLTRETRE